MQKLKKRFKNVEDIKQYVFFRGYNTLFYCDVKNGDFYIEGAFVMHKKMAEGYIGKGGLVSLHKEGKHYPVPVDGSYVYVGTLVDSLRFCTDIFLPDGYHCVLQKDDMIPSMVYKILSDSCSGDGFKINVVCIPEECILTPDSRILC